jgi:hypothetical protein
VDGVLFDNGIAPLISRRFGKRQAKAINYRPSIFIPAIRYE